MVTLSSLMKSCSLTTISTEGINNSLPHLSYPLREECEPVTAHPTLRSTNSVSYLTSKSPTGAWGGKKRNQLRLMEGVFFTLLVVVSYWADLSFASMPYSFLLLFISSLSSVKSARSPFSEVTRAIRRSQIQQQMPGLV